MGNYVGRPEIWTGNGGRFMTSPGIKGGSQNVGDLFYECTPEVH
jgi:hypothetical protein